MPMIMFLANSVMSVGMDIGDSLRDSPVSLVTAAQMVPSVTSVIR